MADITVIGTSNSIIGRNGFISALKTIHNVNNFSLGRSPFYMHISQIIEKKRLIEKSDLLIIDHLSNPFFDQAPFFDEDLESFYDLLASLNVDVIVIALPFIKGTMKLAKNELACKLATEREITFIDLNRLDIPQKLFKDLGHVNIFPSYVIGLWLLNLIGDFSTECSGGNFEGGYYFLKPCNAEKFKTFQSSIVSREYTELITFSDMNFSFRGGRLVSIEFIADGFSVFSVNGENYHVVNDVELVCHEPFLKNIFSENFIVAPKHRKESSTPVYQDRIHPDNIKHTPFKFIGVLIRDKNFEFSYSLGKKVFNIDYILLKNWLTSYSNYGFVIEGAEYKKLQEDLYHTTNLLRDLAIESENVDIRMALKLMSEAHRLRPDGPFIKRKLTEYKGKFEREKSAFDILDENN